MNTSVQSFRHNHIYKTYLGSDEQIHVKSRIPDSIPNSKLLKSIEYLNLSNNCLQDEDGISSLNLLKTLPQIKHIDLSDNFLSNKTLESLPAITFEKLAMLDLSGNKMDVFPLTEAQENTNFTIKHPNLNSVKKSISFQHCNTFTLFDIKSTNNQTPQILEMLINVDNSQLPLLIPVFLETLQTLGQPAPFSQISKNLSSLFTNISLLALSPVKLLDIFCCSTSINLAFKILISNLDQNNRELINKKLVSVSDFLNKNESYNLTCEEINELNNSFEKFTREMHPDQLCKHFTEKEMISYSDIYYELHICIKTILASLLPEHRVNISEFEVFYHKYRNNRYFNPGFLYNSIILGYASRNSELVIEQFNKLFNIINGRDSISQTLNEMIPALKEGIINGLGMNELNL